MNDLLNDRTEHLLLEKPFSELTPEEEIFILRQMDAAEYERLHRLLKNSRAAMRQAPPPSPALRENLLTALRSQQQVAPKLAALPPNRNALLRIAAKRVPLWQAAAAVVGLAFGVHFWRLENAGQAGGALPEGAKTEVVYLTKTDTVYRDVAVPALEKTPVVPATRINVKPSSLPPATLREPMPIASNDTVRRFFAADSMPGPLPEPGLLPEEPTGMSARAVQGWWHFFEEVN